MFDGQPKQVILFETVAGIRPFDEWFDGLRDRRAAVRIDARVTRLEAGNPGDYKFVGDGVYELRVDYGPGYRIYFAFSGQHVVLLLCGGDKTTQQTDIKTAIKYWKEFQQREVQ